MRHKHEQLRLLAAEGDDVTDPYYGAVWARILALLSDVVSVVGVKKAAADLDTSPSVLKHALAERDRHYVRAEWLPYLIDKASSDEILHVLAGIRGLTVTRRQELTAEEKLERLVTLLGDTIGTELREHLLARAFQR